MSKLHKGLMTIIVLALSASVALALTERSPMKYTAKHDVKALTISGTAVTATAAELNIMDGVTATAAEINTAADVSARIGTLTVANNTTSTLSVAVTHYNVTGSGSANLITNTWVIAQPYPLGGEWTFALTSASSNLVKLADSTTVMALGSDAELGPTDTIRLRAIATNEMVKLAGPNNN